MHDGSGSYGGAAVEAAGGIAGTSLAGMRGSAILGGQGFVPPAGLVSPLRPATSRPLAGRRVGRQSRIEGGQKPGRQRKGAGDATLSGPLSVVDQLLVVA